MRRNLANNFPPRAESNETKHNENRNPAPPHSGNSSQPPGKPSSPPTRKTPPTLGPLRPNVFTAVRNFLRCGDLASGFLRFHCPDCGHERLLAFTCKGRHLCPACHQRRVRQTADWIATAVCHEVPHPQFVFTIPKILRGIFRKRRDLPDGKLRAIAALHTFGDYLKRNFEIFKAPDFIAAVIDHLPPKGKQTVRYYCLYSNKTRGQQSLIPDRIILVLDYT